LQSASLIVPINAYYKRYFTLSNHNRMVCEFLLHFYLEKLSLVLARYAIMREIINKLAAYCSVGPYAAPDTQFYTTLWLMVRLRLRENDFISLLKCAFCKLSNITIIVILLNSKFLSDFNYDYKTSIYIILLCIPLC